MAEPRLSFVGRTSELGQLKEVLAVAPAVAVTGPPGAGKTRLVRHLFRELAANAQFVACVPGDTAEALRSRIERTLRCPPGGMMEALTEQVRVLVVDDTHHLREADAVVALPSLIPGPTALGRVVFVGRRGLPVSMASGEIAIGGLDENSARELWQAMEAAYGPTSRGAADKGLLISRGLPLALRREYACAVHGPDAWDLDKLPREAKRVVDALAVLRLPAAPAAIVHLAAVDDLEPVLRGLLARQLVEAEDDGRIALHEVVQDAAMSAMSVEDRLGLEARAATLLASRELADGLGGLDAIDRFREEIVHRLAAGDVATATARIIAIGELALRRGAAAEIESMVAAAGLDQDPGLRALLVELAARAGRIAEAAELATAVATSDLFSAELALAQGEIAAAERLFTEVAAGATDDAGRARAGLCRISALCGRPVAAASRGDARGLDAAWAELVEASRAQWLGHAAEARAHLGRAAAAIAPARRKSLAAVEVYALVQARTAWSLAKEGRLAEARHLVADAQAAASEIDAIAINEEVRAVRAGIAARAGDRELAPAMWAQLSEHRRRRGDECGAVCAEIELAELLVERGQLGGAAERAHPAMASALRMGLAGLAARAELVLAAIDLAEQKPEAAAATLERLRRGGHLDAERSIRGQLLLAESMALRGHRSEAIVLANQIAESELLDAVDRALARARVAVAAGDVQLARDCAATAATTAERAGRGAELAEALAIVARLELARGDRVHAAASATRAAREAAAAGLPRVRCHALLALAALARDDGQTEIANAYARDAADAAEQSRLLIERVAALAALSGISGGDPHADPASPAAATAAGPALGAANRLLADLGLVSERPFRVTSAEGATSEVANADPEVLRLTSRSFAVDGVRETIWRAGNPAADLRRRSLLKRLLFLFAASPERVFSKEEIVQKVWNVEYHPLRHDAALFTNIMRVRRLIGEDGADILRATEEGYRLVPPKDFLFVQAVG